MDTNSKVSSGHDELGTSSSPRERELFAEEHWWIVREIPAPEFDRLGGNHLLFQADGVMRRVRVFPHDWDRLSDAALYALCDHVTR